MKEVKKGMRVRVKSLNIKGKVFYINWPLLYADHMYPIQVELDKPYDEHGQTMYRTNLKDLVRLKKAATKPAKKKKKETFDDSVFTF